VPLICFVLPTIGPKVQSTSARKPVPDFVATSRAKAVFVTESRMAKRSIQNVGEKIARDARDVRYDTVDRPGN
jgi:hypothetical protein